MCFGFPVLLLLLLFMFSYVAPNNVHKHVRYWGCAALRRPISTIRNIARVVHTNHAPCSRDTTRIVLRNSAKTERTYCESATNLKHNRFMNASICSSFVEIMWRTFPLAVPPLTPIKNGRWRGRSVSNNSPAEFMLALSWKRLQGWNPTNESSVVRSPGGAWSITVWFTHQPWLFVCWLLVNGTCGGFSFRGVWWPRMRKCRWVAVKCKDVY